jgi:murein DD-endopeptidase MepM/ murein hydrolase activator NlpD
LLLRGELVLAERDFVIASRPFKAETISLDKSLTSLRADPDPRKTEQAARYLALIAAVDPAAVFLTEGFVRPVAGDRRTSLFGDKRRYRYFGGGEAFSEHAGIDYGYPVGTPVRAAGRGRVVMAEDRIVTGQTIVIEHLPGVYTIYMHLSAMDLAIGDLVERAAPIGRLGATGLATGPHLHWELRILGVASDPEAWVGIDKVPYIRTINATIEGR